LILEFVPCFRYSMQLVYHVIILSCLLSQ
jgi:hypothetical protein